MKLGLDLWGVILSTTQGCLHEPRVYEQNVFTCVKEISDTIGADNTYVVSIIQTAHLDVHIKTFLEDDLHQKLGIPACNVNFVFRDYFDDEKTFTKAEQVTELGITHFVDDSLAILKRLPDGVRRFWYNARLGYGEETLLRVQNHTFGKDYTHYNDWRILKSDILAK